MKGKCELFMGKAQSSLSFWSTRRKLTFVGSIYNLWNLGAIDISQPCTLSAENLNFVTVSDAMAIFNPDACFRQVSTL